MDFVLYHLTSLVSGSVVGGISLGGELVESESTFCGDFVGGEMGAR